MRLGSTFVSVEVEIEEVLDRLNESKLIEYCAHRIGSGKIPISGAFETLVREAYDLLNAGENDIAKLRGKNLACWCRADQACHADVLLELANRVPPPNEGTKP